MRIKEILRESNYEGYKLLSSNQNKIREFNRFGLNLTIQSGQDLPEVQGTPEEVIIHKAKDAGPMCCVEDTSLEIEGLDVGVNIRWVQDQLISNAASLEGRKAVWTTYVGVNTGEEIKVFKGQTIGSIVSPRGNSFAFDPIFLIPSVGKTLSELDAIGKKDDYSARKQACIAMMQDKPILTVKISDVHPWNGKYQ